MWVLFTIFVLGFIVGGILILLRTANVSKIPKNIKAQPYEDDDDD